MAKMNVGIIFGGQSSEHEVSRISAEAIIKNISKDKYNLFLIGITKQGKWSLFSGDISEIPNGNWEKNSANKAAFISPDASVGGLVTFDGDKTEVIKLDCVIPVLHGKNGEDGTVQGLLELAEIPFVGCDTASSAACMDKTITNSMLAFNGINKPVFNWFYAYDFKKKPEKYLKETEDIIGSYPMFVKPANAGSSVGITKVNNREELVKGIEIAAREDRKILVEQGIVGQEVECSVLGNEEPIASVTGEIAPSNEFYDYDAKYLSGSSELFIPARIPEEVSEEVRETAVRAYKIMGCTGLARVDFFVEKGTNKVLLNEINTFPGFTSISMYPKLLNEIGIGFAELIDKLIEFGVSKKTSEK